MIMILMIGKKKLPDSSVVYSMKQYPLENLVRGSLLRLTDLMGPYLLKKAVI